MDDRELLLDDEDLAAVLEAQAERRRRWPVRRPEAAALPLVVPPGGVDDPDFQERGVPLVMAQSTPGNPPGKGPMPRPRVDPPVRNAPEDLRSHRVPRVVRPPAAPQTGGPAPLAADMIKKAIVGTEAEQLAAERAIFSEGKELWESLKGAKALYTKAGASAAEKAAARTVAKEVGGLLLKQGAKRVGASLFGPWGTAITLGALAAELPIVQDGFMYVRDRTPGMKLPGAPKRPKWVGPPGPPDEVIERLGLPEWK